MAQVLTACRSAGPDSVDLMAAGYVWISADSANHEASHGAGVASGLTAAVTAELLDGMLNFYGSPAGTAGYARFEADWSTHTRDDCIK
jgi:hypothetical protein